MPSEAPLTDMTLHRRYPLRWELEDVQIRAIIQDLSLQQMELENARSVVVQRLAAINERLTAVKDDLANHHRALHRVRPERIVADVLTLIFVFALPEDLETLPSEHHAPISVSRVCRYWRDVAFAAPELWSRINLDFSRPPRYDENLWLAVSSRSTVSLPSIRISGFGAHLQSHITLHVRRIHHLEIGECHVPDLLRILPIFTALFTLDVTIGALDISYFDTGYDQFLPGTIELPHIHSLSLRTCSSVEVSQMLRPLKTPHMKSLELDYRRATQAEWEEDFASEMLKDLAEFQSTSNFALEHLTLYNAAVGEIDQSIFPSLRTLRISEHPSTMDCYYEWLRTETFFPLLEELTIQLNRTSPGIWYSFALQAARARGPLTRFSLPSSGARSLKRIRITCLTDKSSNHRGAYGLPASWCRRIVEFAASGLEIQFDPFLFDVEDEAEYWDDIHDPWPQ